MGLQMMKVLLSWKVMSWKIICRHWGSWKEKKVRLLSGRPFTERLWLTRHQRTGRELRRSDGWDIIDSQLALRIGQENNNETKRHSVRRLEHHELNDIWCFKRSRHTHNNLSDNLQVVMMWNMFSKKTLSTHTQHAEPTTHHIQLFAEAVKYYSDESNSEDDTDSGSESDNEWNNALPPYKHQCQEIAYHIERQMKKEVRQKECEVVLKDLQKKIQLKKTKFILGQNGLWAHWVAAVEMHLWLVVSNGWQSQDASEHAAESQGFAPKWGGHQVHMWTRLWIRMWEFPQSLIGWHAKIYLLLSNPEIAAELRVYIHSNKWVMDLEKLSKFLKDQLVPKATEEYLCLIMKEEMPWGLKKYIELKLFPHIHLRVGHSISLATAWRWLHSEGFRYTTHKKGLYFDGHDRADVVEYHQKVFLPAMKAYKPWLVWYVVGDVD